MSNLGLLLAGDAGGHALIASRAVHRCVQVLHCCIQSRVPGVIEEEPQSVLRMRDRTTRRGRGLGGSHGRKEEVGDDSAADEERHRRGADEPRVPDQSARRCCAGHSTSAARRSSKADVRSRSKRVSIHSNPSLRSRPLSFRRVPPQHGAGWFVLDCRAEHDLTCPRARGHASPADENGLR